MPKGKAINLFLLTGSVTGAIKYTLPNWTGVIYKIPRTALADCINRDDLKHTGVYFLFGKSEEEKDVVYVGQATTRKNGNGLLGRILEHKRNPQKDYWTEAVALTTTNNTFGPTEISYLENQFTKLALDAKRYIVKNENEPNSGNITEEKQSELEEVIEYSKIIMGILGHKIFIPLDEENSNENKKANVFYLKERGADAHGFQSSDGFVVCKKSVWRNSPTASCSEGIKKLRKKYATDIDKNSVLINDVLFSSPSAASAFCVFGSSNGQIAWKTENGQTLKAFDSQK